MDKFYINKNTGIVCKSSKHPGSLWREITKDDLRRLNTVSVEKAAQQSVQPTPSKTPPDYHKGDWIGNVYLGSE